MMGKGARKKVHGARYTVQGTRYKVRFKELTHRKSFSALPSHLRVNIEPR